MTDDTPHTPGPWQVQRGSLTVFTCSNGDTGITQAIAAPLDGNGDFGRATVEANARLIAAAPQLLEACRKLVQLLTDAELVGGPNGDVAKARAVITLATGGTASDDVAKLRAEVERLQRIIDSRPAINAALPESYIKWSQSIYVMEVGHVSGSQA